MWVSVCTRPINSIRYDLSRGQMFLIFMLLMSIFQISVTLYSLVNKESQDMFCNLFCPVTGKRLLAELGAGQRWETGCFACFRLETPHCVTWKRQWR